MSKSAASNNKDDANSKQIPRRFVVSLFIDRVARFNRDKFGSLRIDAKPATRRVSATRFIHSRDAETE
ncbi:hypothetical protein RSSM_02119 [Rhodopirellula sallentina SM41]|uniref:Uncharacterized protein n=1 Tax=Rhodopirellula sallentina SM41 TaxID=1263870 RepID=M5UK75_9BACT|nr:hypothetical protein RSSM_02119 [Rhodopirellula sallentina SM41]